MSIGDKIKSLREGMGFEYKKPDPNLPDVYVAELATNQLALDYLKKNRNLTDDTIKHFKLGYDKSRNAISIPVYKKGVLVNIKYRLLDNPNLRYSGEEGAETWMYNEGGLEVARRKGAVMIVEGEFDCMSVWQAGIYNVVSPASGKDSAGIWLEELENIAKVYIAYDNDEGGKGSSKKLAERLGYERCYEVIYRGAKDANEYLGANSPEDFRTLIKESVPYIREQFKGIGDVINLLRQQVDDTFESRFIPGVKWQKGWMGVLSGVSNVGKTSFVLNVANELADQGAGVLILPFERGIESVGARFLHVRCNASPEDMHRWGATDWDKVKEGAADLQVYFAMPDKSEVVDFIVKAKRYFDTNIVIVDHIDYLVRQTTGSRGDAIMNTLQELKRVAEDNGIVLLIVSHIRKIEEQGAQRKRKRPGIEDLKGSSSLYQDPETVVMLSQGEKGDVLVDVVKNKGEMLGRYYSFNKATGVYSESGDIVDKSTIEVNEVAEGEFDNGVSWN